MKLLILTITILFSLSVLADEVRIVNKLDGKVIYVSPEELELYIGDDGEYIIDKPISLPTPSVEIMDSQSNQSIENRSQSTNVSKLNINGETVTLPTDPNFYLQYFWGAPTTNYYSYSNISQTYGTPTPLRKARVGIVDSGFWNNSDLTFTEGYNFVDISGLGLSPNATWQQTGSTQADREACGYSHGTGVASVIGATRNNGIGIAGIADVDLIAGKAMECNTGYFIDAINAMDWMSGESFGSAPNISSPVDVINMSLGGIGACQPYMQQAFDRMAAKGILVVVSAGNDNVDTSIHYPSNCDGVITTSALTRTGELASFSNFGSTNNVGALGEKVYALGPADGLVYGWDGTSFASPITAGILARTIVRYPNVLPSVIAQLLFQSSGGFNPALNCGTKGCGVGVSNATNLDNMTKSYNDGTIFTFKSALAEMPFCDKTKYFTFSGDKARLCALTRVVFTDDNHYNASDTYELYKVSTGSDLTVLNGSLVLSTNDKETMLTNTDIDLTSYDYGFRVCTSGVCKISTLIPANLNYFNSPTECI